MMICVILRIDPETKSFLSRMKVVGSNYKELVGKVTDWLEEESARGRERSSQFGCNFVHSVLVLDELSERVAGLQISERVWVAAPEVRDALIEDYFTSMSKHTPALPEAFK